jgi:multidrug efflux pump subunit AcrA (membrane-fusion protein)
MVQHLHEPAHADVALMSTEDSHLVVWLFVLPLALLAAIMLAPISVAVVAPAVVVAESKLELIAPADGIVRDVFRRPGEQLAPNQAVIQLEATNEAAEVLRLNAIDELNRQRRLLDPTDAAAREAITSARTDGQRLRALQLRNRVSAPVDTVVARIHVRVGQYVRTGEATRDIGHFGIKIPTGDVVASGGRGGNPHWKRRHI